MNETDATVVRLEGAYAWVQAAGPEPACGSCTQKGSCSSASKFDDTDGKTRKPLLLRLPNTIQARPGDAVIIHAADGVLFKAVWRAYGIPLLLALAGAMLAVLLTGSESLALLAILAGLLAGFLLMRARGLDSSRTEPIFSMNFKHTSFFSVKGP